MLHEIDAPPEAAWVVEHFDADVLILPGAPGLAADDAYPTMASDFAKLLRETSATVVWAQDRDARKIVAQKDAIVFLPTILILANMLQSDVLTHIGLAIEQFRALYNAHSPQTVRVGYTKPDGESRWFEGPVSDSADLRVVLDSVLGRADER